MEFPPDVIAALAGIPPGSALDLLRDRRPAAKTHAQRTFDALFQPEHPDPMPVAERVAVAAFVTGLHGPSATADFYADRLLPEQSDAIAAAIAAGAGHGPCGHYPDGPLAQENTHGAVFDPSGQAAVLGHRLAAAFAHAHMLVFAPRSATPAHMRALEAAGWSADGIVTLSQLVAFLSFQLRVVLGLKHLAAEREGRA